METISLRSDFIGESEVDMINFRRITTKYYKLLYPEDITPHIIEMFNKSFQLVNTLKEIKPKRPTIFFCRNNEVTITLTTENKILLGEYWRDIIAYNLDELEKKNDWVILTCLLEELVHCYCDTTDEKTARQIVASLIPEIYFDASTMDYRLKENNEIIS